MCQGVANWKYYPWANWADPTNNGVLKTVTFNKTRNDTILRVEFHTIMAQGTQGQGSEYSIQFGSQDCFLPAPIVTSIYNGYYGPGYWHSVPAELSGFCTSTADGLLKPGDIQISVHVKLTYSGSGQTNTGKLDRGQITSYLLVEEYCP